MAETEKQEVKKIDRYSTEEEREIFRIAVSHMNMHVFVYDVTLDKLFFLGCGTPPFGTLTKSEYSAADIVALGILDAESAEAFLSLFRDIRGGERSASAVVKTMDGSRVNWDHVVLINYYNDSHRPIRAIGTIQDVSSRIETELRYSMERKFRMAMMAESRRVYEVNVTRDRFAKLESLEDSTDCGGWKLYTESMAALCKAKVYREDWDTFLKVASRESLLDGFSRDITEFYCEYRVLDDSGNPVWSSSATHLLRDPLTNDIKGFIYVKDIDHKKRQEIELCHQAERDPLTGLYNRRTAERLITQLLMASEQDYLHAMLTIDIDEFKNVNDNFGHARGDYLLQQLAERLSGALRSEDLFARMGGDEFIVFLNRCGSAEHAVEVANRFCNVVRGICVDEATDFHSTISIGIALYPQGGGTFAELYQNSDYSMYQVKRHGKNNVSVYMGRDGANASPFTVQSPPARESPGHRGA